MLPGMRATAAAAAGTSKTFTFVTSSTSNSSTVTIPASASAGDLAVVFDGAFTTGSISSVTPSGWSTAIDATGNSTFRMKVNYKLLTAANLGTSPAFSNGYTDRKIILIFRPNVAITSIIISAWNSEITTGDPVSQTVLATGIAAPLIVFAFGSVNTTTGPAFTDTPAMTEVTNNGSGASVRVGYIIYNSAPADQSIDIADGGSNGLQSGYLRFT